MHLFNVVSPDFDRGRAQLMVNKPVSSCSSLGPCVPDDAAYLLSALPGRSESSPRGDTRLVVSVLYTEQLIEPGVFSS